MILYSALAYNKSFDIVPMTLKMMLDEIDICLTYKIGYLILEMSWNFEKNSYPSISVELRFL